MTMTTVATDRAAAMRTTTMMTGAVRGAGLPMKGGAGTAIRAAIPRPPAWVGRSGGPAVATTMMTTAVAIAPAAATTMTMIGEADAAMAAGTEIPKAITRPPSAAAKSARAAGPGEAPPMTRMTMTAAPEAKVTVAGMAIRAAMPKPHVGAGATADF